MLELPYTITGDWGSEEEFFVAVGDQALRQDLSQENGAGLVGFKQLGAGAVDRSLMAKAREKHSPEVLAQWDGRRSLLQLVWSQTMIYRGSIESAR